MISGRQGVVVTKEISREYVMKQKTNCFRSLIREVKTLKQRHNPLPLFDDLHTDTIDGEYEFSTSIKTLHLVSRAIENTLKAHKRRCTLYTGFQVLSHFAGYLDRYRQLADFAKEIFIVGVADIKLTHIADNVHVMTKHAHLVRDNWFSVILGENIHMALIAEELPVPGKHNYDGFYSNSRAVTDKALQILNDNTILAKELEYGEQKRFF